MRDRRHIEEREEEEDDDNDNVDDARLATSSRVDTAVAELRLSRRYKSDAGDNGAEKAPRHRWSRGAAFTSDYLDQMDADEFVCAPKANLGSNNGDGDGDDDTADLDAKSREQTANNDDTTRREPRPTISALISGALSNLAASEIKAAGLASGGIGDTQTRLVESGSGSGDGDGDGVGGGETDRLGAALSRAPLIVEAPFRVARAIDYLAGTLVERRPRLRPVNWTSPTGAQANNSKSARGEADKAMTPMTLAGARAHEKQIKSGQQDEAAANKGRSDAASSRRQSSAGEPKVQQVEIAEGEY